MWKFFLFLKILALPTDSRSNTINTTSTVSLPNNTPVFPNCDKDDSLLSEAIDSLAQFLTHNFKTLRKYLRLNPIVREQTLKMSLTYLLSHFN